MVEKQRQMLGDGVGVLVVAKGGARYPLSASDPLGRIDPTSRKPPSCHLHRRVSRSTIPSLLPTHAGTYDRKEHTFERLQSMQSSDSERPRYPHLPGAPISCRKTGVPRQDAPRTSHLRYDTRIQSDRWPNPQQKSSNSI
jgi:hypothetical protein